MNYRSVSDMGTSARQLAQSLPADIDLVVGIPRSGLLAANLLCLSLDRPMTDVDGLCSGRLLQTGHRYDGDVASFDDLDRVLVIDDSVKSGQQMTETQTRLDAMDFPFEVEYAAIYVSQKGHQFVDYWAEVVDVPRVFEWNLMHHPMLKRACFDLDGVLCRDPTPEERDGGPRYREYLTGVKPQIIPSERIGWLVTSRSEKYRAETEQWLADNHVEYEELVMMGDTASGSRGERDRHAEFKTDLYSSTDSVLFVESDCALATTISERTGKPVYCYDDNQMIRPGFVAETRTKSSRYLSELTADPAAFLATASGYIASQGYNRLAMAAHRYRNG